MKATIVDLQQREKVLLDKQRGIFNNGVDNAYPQRVERIINNSVTAKAAVDKAKAFFVGDGFVDTILNDIIINEDGTTLYEILTQISHSVSRQKAASIQVQYNANYDVAGLKNIPYRNVRIGKKDSNGYSGLMHVYSNWEKRDGDIFKPQDAWKLNVFNPIKKVVAAQFDDNYMGQVAMLKLDDDFVYPLAQIDPTLEDADTEAQIKNFKNGELRGGFFAKYLVYHTAFESEEDQANFKKTLTEFQGGDHKKSLLLIPATFDEQGNFVADANIKLEKIEQNINDKIFESYEKSVANNIRKSIWNIPSILIEQQDSAMFGSSGEAMKAAFELYNSETRMIRKSISGWLKKILSNSGDIMLKNANFDIKELSYGNTLDTTGAAGY